MEPWGNQSALEIARARAHEPSSLILDFQAALPAQSPWPLFDGLEETDGDLRTARVVHRG